MTASHTQASSKTVTQLYETMYTIRRVETTLLDLFSEGKLQGTTHTCLGQEACAAGVVLALDPEIDIVVSNHRGHGHYISHTGDVAGLFREVMGKQGGPSEGIGGSQHLFGRNFYSNGILGGTSALGVGVAMAEKLNRSRAIVALFLGDGAMGEGIVYEAFNIASLWSLPVLFVIECNQYAQSTPTHLEVAGSIADRLRSFGIDTMEVDDSDALELHGAAVKSVESVRSAGEPKGLVIQTYRLGPHSKGDDDRDSSELASHWDRDPLASLVAKLPREERESIESVVNHTVSVAVESAVQVSEMSWEDFSERLAWR